MISDERLYPEYIKKSNNPITTTMKIQFKNRQRI